ncbi:hypothetical protein BCAR13_100067 [Paraburkholderia caribensis]|nr:hypothetical protein BCAR13_100067 [Paraburkholderia caribensis]
MGVRIRRRRPRGVVGHVVAEGRLPNAVEGAPGEMSDGL